MRYIDPIKEGVSRRESAGAEQVLRTGHCGHRSLIGSPGVRAGLIACNTHTHKSLKHKRINSEKVINCYI